MVLLEASGKQTLSDKHYDSLSHDIKRQREAISTLKNSSTEKRERIHCPGWTDQQFQQSRSVLAGRASAPNVMVFSIFLLLFVLLFGGIIHRDTLLPPKLSQLGNPSGHLNEASQSVSAGCS